jgi:hypothetical protein
MQLGLRESIQVDHDGSWEPQDDNGVLDALSERIPPDSSRGIDCTQVQEQRRRRVIEDMTLGIDRFRNGARRVSTSRHAI